MHITVNAMKWLKIGLLILIIVLVTRLLYGLYEGGIELSVGSHTAPAEILRPEQPQRPEGINRAPMQKQQPAFEPEPLPANPTTSSPQKSTVAGTPGSKHQQFTVLNPLPPGACSAYSELRNLNFLHKSIKENICEDAVAYTVVNSAFPLCRLKQQLPQLITDAVKAGSAQTFILSPLTRRSVPSFVYSSPDLISMSIRNAHIFEERNVRIMQHIVQKLNAQSPVTFIDIGSNIGVFTLSTLDLGVPVIALDANIRNLIRIKLSSEATKLPHKLHLLWNFISRQVSLMYLNFPQDCNIGGATKFGRAVVDTIPIMSANADSIVGLVKTKFVVLKVDIEGGEGEFFKSAQKMFESFTIPVVHMEWLKRHMNEEERLFMIKFFTDRHYSPRTMLDLNRLINIQDSNYNGDDLIWIHEDYIKNGTSVF